ncbi:hypothetical protein Sste5346_002810 [Sporothrix stenoceras]|uniref:Alcohol dehydrogenase-like C-terminal domain-containing protein n=1 Tax=Sporothrix stenoceras TaxID=5173 RepID=A0ABR3ZGX1_9PEZI
MKASATQAIVCHDPVEGKRQWILEPISIVTKVQPGDAVLLSFAFCTQCHNCQFGAPGYCHKFTELNFVGNKEAFPGSKDEPSKAIGGSFFGQSSLAQHTRVQETSMVKVTHLVNSREELSMFAPLGCGIQTGAGTITQLGQAGPNNKSAIMAAKLTGCRNIIGIDRVASRLELAKILGATHVVNTSELSGTLVDEIRNITGGSGSTITVDATGATPLIQQGVEFTPNQGKMILLGVAPMDAGFEVQIIPYMVTGKQLMGSMEGGVYPEQESLADRPIFQLITVKDYLKAVRDMEDGVTIKPILLW